MSTSAPAMPPVVAEMARTLPPMENNNLASNGDDIGINSGSKGAMKSAKK